SAFEQAIHGLQERSQNFILLRALRNCILSYYRYRIQAAIVSFLLLICGGCERLQDTGLAPGQTAPDLSLVDLDGKPAKLSEQRGGVVLLNFWASWCAPCIAEMPELEVLHRRLSARGFKVLGVAVDDTPDAVHRIQKEFKITYPILLDERGESRRLYKFTGFPESFVLDAQGKLVMIIDPGSAQPVVRMVGPRNWRTGALISQLEALLGGLGA
ncbi:MAG: hypothetical protein DCC75_05930, partial [Proteobacteria bacterium]